MPIIFKIKNKRKFLSWEDCLSVADLLQVIPNLSEYSADKDLFSLDLNALKLNDVNSLWLGIEETSSLGFRLSYDSKGNYYKVEISLYATAEDWKITLKYLSALSTMLGNPVEESKSKFTAQEILMLNYKEVMEVGVDNLLSRIEDADLTLYGVKRPVIFSVRLRDELNASSDKVKLLDIILYSCQYPKAYVHKQTFHFNNGGKTLFGNYSIGENLKAVLPTNPFVEIYNERLLIGHPLTHWTMTITKKDGNGDYQLHKICEYNSFLKNIPTDKCLFLDDNFIIVEPMSMEELEEIIKKADVLDKYAQFNE